eukprot:8178099-Lingulodinium_polyedra.AAC.1
MQASLTGVLSSTTGSLLQHLPGPGHWAKAMLMPTSIIWRPRMQNPRMPQPGRFRGSSRRTIPGST